MSNGLGRPVGGSDKDEIGLHRAPFRRRRWLRKVPQRRILMAPLLRISSLLEGGVVMTNLEAILVTQTSRGLFIRGSEGYGEAKCDASHAGRYLRSVRTQLTKHRRRNSGDLSFSLEEEGGCQEVLRELADHHPHPKKGYDRRDPLSPRPYQHPQHACASWRRAMSWEQQMPILPEL
jgi:hypothetical protein